jgi:small-conductance mechanosensitive channel
MLSTGQEIMGPIGQLWKHKLFTIAGIKLSLGNVLVALTLLFFASRLSRLAVKLINKRLILPFVSDRSSQITYQTFAFYGCLSLFVTLSLTIAGIPLTVFTVVGGALAIGVGFGSQNIVNNFISGVILLIERPIKVGDVVDLEGLSGTVTSIGTRSTKIKNADNKIFIVPNSFFLEKSVLNWTYDATSLRGLIEFGVAYGSDVKMVEKISLDILSGHPHIEKHPHPIVLFTDFSESNLMFQMIFFCNIEKLSDIPLIKSQIRFELDEKFRQHKIEMAFPQRDLHLKTKTLDVRVLS